MPQYLTPETRQYAVVGGCQASMVRPIALSTRTRMLTNDRILDKQFVNLEKRCENFVKVREGEHAREPCVDRH